MRNAGSAPCVLKGGICHRVLGSIFAGVKILRQIAYEKKLKSKRLMEVNEWH